MQIKANIFIALIFILAGCQTVPDAKEVINWKNQGYNYRDGTKDIQQDYKKSFEFFSKAANAGLANAQTNVGWLYENGFGVNQDDKKAFYWYQKAADQGEIFAKDKYARYLINGKGGVIDIEKALAIYRNEIDKKHAESFYSFQEALREIRRTYSFNIDEVQPLYWMEYIAKNNITYMDEDAGKACRTACGDRPCKDHSITPVIMYNRIADAYLDKISSGEKIWIDNDKEEKALAIAKKYYNLAHNETKLTEINKNISRPKYKINKSAPSFCKAVFPRADSDFQYHQDAQTKIFQHPDKADEVVKEYRDHYQNIYHYKPGSENITLNFTSLPVESLLTIAFDFLDGKYKETNITFDESLTDLSVMISETEHPEVIMNHFLKVYDLKPACHGSELHISADKKLSGTRFYTGNLITKWTGDIHYSDSLNGRGVINSASDYAFDGDIKNNLPNGSGKLKGGLRFEGSMFRDGILSGYGRQYSGDDVVYEGGFKDNNYEGYGSLSMRSWSTYAYFNYKGEFKKGKPEGGGLVTFLDIGEAPLRPYVPIHNNYVPTWSYEGVFVDGVMHGEGKCKAFQDRKVVDHFACEFYKGNLIKVGSVSLLPEGADLSSHFENLELYGPYL